MANESGQTASSKELIIERLFDAPRDLVWKAWTDVEILKQWWGPKGVTNPVCEMDARAGGAINIVMLAGKELGELAGNKWPMTGTVKEVSAPEKLVFTSSAIVNNKPILETLVTVTFEPQEQKTKMRLHIVVTMETPEAAGPLAGMKMGWTQSIDKLGEFVSQH